MTARCKQCDQVFDIDVTADQLRRWQEGELIQRAMPELSVDLRELLISGTCGKCFDKMFGEES